MRIFLLGNEDVAKWHLPVAQSKVAAFADECRKKGLKQNRFTFLFEETGAIVEAQYAFGQVAMQIHAPFIPLVEEEIEEPIEELVAPKTFWVNTTQGYFWVEVRYIDNAPQVILTPFEAFTGESFVYPGMALTAPGMISGCFGDSPATRYVLSQNGGVMSGEGEQKGTIESTAVIEGGSRLTVVGNSTEIHDFVLMQSSMGQAAEVRRIRISNADGAFVIDRKYASVFMAYEGEVHLPISNLLPNPVWVHRKCNGSYFSPNKTIGYHVDIGADDGFLGNLTSVSGGDLLDNTGGFGEALFNHTQDLYRLAGILAFPVSVDASVIEIVLVSPTMGFSGTEEDKCWGGYELTQDYASCADYRKDFGSWLLAPRFVIARLNLETDERYFEDVAIDGSAAKTWDVNSWDRAFKGSATIEMEYSCDTDFYSDMSMQPAGKQCSWAEVCAWTCDTNDPGSSGQCPKGWMPYSYWQYFSSENIRNSKRAYFIFGDSAKTPENPSAMHGFYLLFDGRWHLDIGVLWSSSMIEGNYCGLCAYPYGSQVPGELVYFSVQGVDTNWVLAHGHEYVSNMEVVAPLGYITWPLGGSQVGFIAKVPDDYAAPHDPVLMKGGIRFPSEDVDGADVFCERALMSAPCDCDGTEMHFDPYSGFDLGQVLAVQVIDGCAPFEWSMRGANVAGKSYFITDQRSMLVSVEDGCSASLLIKDACGTELTLSDEYQVTGLATGPAALDAGESATFTHNLRDAVYTGTLTLVEETGNGATLMMPSGASSGATYTASWTGKCDSSANVDVLCLPECPEFEYDHIAIGYAGIGDPPAYVGAKVYSVGHMGHPNGAVLTVTGLDTVSRGTPGCVAGTWSLVYIEGSSYVFVECIGANQAHWHQFGPPQFCEQP